MNALIFSAGLGTRMAPLTDNLPKALVELNGKPLLSYALAKCADLGVTRAVVNVHHFGQQIIDYLSTQRFDGMEIVISDERDFLLDTGGGLIKALPLFEPRNPILLYNVDIFTNANLWELKKFHYRHDGIATLMVNKRKGSRYFLLNSDYELCGWENTATGEKIIVKNEANLEQWGFCGIHIVEYDFIEKLGVLRKFSITNGYLDLAAANEKIFGWNDWEGYWYDAGSPEKLAEVANIIGKK